MADIYLYANQRGIEIKEVKKQSKYFSLQLNMECEDRVASICFRDILNYTSPMTMDKYVKSWTGKQSKLIFPYLKYAKIEEVRADQEFPRIEDFYNDLKQVNIIPYKFYTFLISYRISYIRFFSALFSFLVSM